MRMTLPRALVAVMLLLSADTLVAQHAAHEMGGMPMDSTAHAWHVMAQAIPLLTRASPSAGGVTKTEATLTQPILMARGRWRETLALDATFDAEGLTMRDGELNTGGAGEGFVDRRHPHTYVQEIMASALGAMGAMRYSVSLGRGFASFGTDDPMMRPIVKFPLNHHLAQILERGVIVAAVRGGPVMAEASSFGGDEPTSPSSAPAARRLGDSWSLRSTLLPIKGAEIQASYARVASPEQVSGFGLDQRKQSVSARLAPAASGWYALAEWEKTQDHDSARALDVFAYESVLAEGSIALGRASLSLRLEQTERPEEDRLADPSRTPRPASDLSINGITRWRAATLNGTGSPVTVRALSGLPFVEVALLSASPKDPRSIFTPERLYGTSAFTMITVGMRLVAGSPHTRMGRYGVAVP